MFIVSNTFYQTLFKFCWKKLLSINILTFTSYRIRCIDIHMSVHRKYNSILQPTRCNVSWFIYFYWRSTCFRRFLRPLSGAHKYKYSFRYCQPILLLAAIVDEMELHELNPIYDSSQQQYWLTIPEAVCTVMCSWWWAEEPPETCTESV